MANSSRDISIKLAPFWMEGTGQTSALSERVIQRRPPGNSNSKTKVVVTDAEAGIRVKKILGDVRAGGGNMSQLVVGLDAEFVAAGAVGRKAPNTPRQLPTVIQVRLSEAPTTPQMRLVVFFVLLSSVKTLHRCTHQSSCRT